MSPPPPGSHDAELTPSGLRFWVEHQWQTWAARRVLVEVKATARPRTMNSALEGSWRSPVSANKQTEGQVFHCAHWARTHCSYCILVSNCQHLSTSSLMVSTSQEVPKHPGEMLAVDEVKRPCKTSRGLNQGPLGTNAVFLFSLTSRHGTFPWMETPLILNTFPPHPHIPGTESSRRYDTSISECGMLIS